MKRASLLITTVLVIGAMGATATAAEDRADRVRVIVGFEEAPDLQPDDTFQGFRVVDVVDDLRIAVVEASGLDAVQSEVLDVDDVRYIERDHHEWWPSFTPNDPRYPDQYGPQITRTEGAWDVTLGSTSVKLGLLDTGITPDHEDFVNDRISGHDYVNDDGTPEDAGNCGYHGSHTSGTAAATTDNGAGIAGMSESSIIMHKIFDNGGFFGCGAASTSDIAQALKDLGDKGAHISSNSWGGSSNSSTLNDAIDYAHDKGVIHVAAAGNDGECTDCIGEPWASRPGKTIIVTCSDSNDDFCSFSSQGPETDLIAPGNNVLSVDGGDLDGYQEKSGTSMSTPHVSGAIGLYIAANGDADQNTIEGALHDTGDDLGLSAERQGGGRLNTTAFVASGDGGGNSAPTASFTHSCTDLNCTFDASNSSDSDGNITSYDWEFGDGGTGSGEIVDHTYAENGSYTVNLTVTDDDNATDTESQTIQVGNAAPSAHFTHSCTDLNCTFDASNSSDSDGNITSYDWEFGDGTTGSGEIVDHTYNSSGNYTVNLTVTDDDGATNTTSDVVSVGTSDAGGIHSGDLDGTSSNQGSTWTATVTVTVHDADHNAESGSNVTFDYKGRDVSGTVNCTSGTDGTCSVSVSGIPKRTSSVDFTVTDISDPDGTYDSSSNHDPDGDSDGTTITVTKP